MARAEKHDGGTQQSKPCHYRIVIQHYYESAGKLRYPDYGVWNKSDYALRYGCNIALKPVYKLTGMVFSYILNGRTSYG